MALKSISRKKAPKALFPHNPRPFHPSLILEGPLKKPRLLKKKRAFLLYNLTNPPSLNKPFRRDYPPEGAAAREPARRRRLEGAKAPFQSKTDFPITPKFSIILPLIANI
jgi:hypothetical protein